MVSGESGGEKENTEENTVDHPVFGGRHNDAEGEKEQTKLLRAISQRLEKIEGKLDDQQQDIASLHSEQPPTSPPQTVPLQPTSGRSPTKCKASDAASVLAADLELKRTATAARGNAGRNWCGLLGQVSAPRDMARLILSGLLPIYTYLDSRGCHPMYLAYISMCTSGVPHLGARGQTHLATKRQGPNPRAESQRGAAIVARRGQRDAPFGGQRRRRPCQGCARRRQDERATA